MSRVSSIDGVDFVESLAFMVRRMQTGSQSAHKIHIDLWTYMPYGIKSFAPRCNLINGHDSGHEKDYTLVRAP